MDSLKHSKITEKLELANIMIQVYKKDRKKLRKSV